MKKTNYAESETGDFNSCVTIKAIQILILKIPSKKKTYLQIQVVHWRTWTNV